MKVSVGVVRRVLACLLDAGEAVTRPALADTCGLSRPTVFAAVDHLESLGLVQQVGQANGRPGRSPVLYDVALGAGLTAAVDIGGSNVRVALSDVRGQVLSECTEPTAPGGATPIVDQVGDLARTARKTLPDPDRPLMLAAVSVPGVVGTDGRTVLYASNIDQPTPFDFGTPLSQQLGCDVVLDNNVNLAAVAERWLGVATDLDTFAVIAVGAGIGAGIVHGGTVLRGAHGAAGEVAFLPPDGRQRRVDPAAHDEAGGLNFLHQARNRPGWSGALPTTVQEVFERAAAGELPAVALVEEECERVAAVVAAVCAVIDPEQVVLTGGVGGNELLISGTERHVAEMTIFPPSMVASDLGGRASLLGAVHLARHRARDRLLDSLGD
jgi:predicted NBD/HSP70 family sugar kinase